MIHGLDGGGDVAEVVALAAAGNLLVGALGEVGVLVLVNVDGGVGAEVDGVGAGTEGSIEFGGVEDLGGEGFPTAGGTSVGETGPALADAAELRFDGGEELIHDGVAVGAEVGAVDGVGVVIEGVGVLDLDDEEAGEAGRGPLLEELVGFLLLDAIVAGEFEAVGVVGLEGVVGWLGAEAFEVGGEVAVEEHEGEFGLGVLVEAVWQEDVGAEVHGAAPEFGEAVALDAYVFDVLCVLWRGDGGDGFGEGELEAGAGLDGELDGFGEEVAGGAVPLAAFATVGREFEGMAIGAAEGLIEIEENLDVVVAGRELGEAADGVAVGFGGEDVGGARGELVDVGAEDDLGLGRIGNLEAWFGGGVSGEEQEQAAVEGLASQ